MQLLQGGPGRGKKALGSGGEMRLFQCSETAPTDSSLPEHVLMGRGPNRAQSLQIEDVALNLNALSYHARHL